MKSIIYSILAWFVLGLAVGFAKIMHMESLFRILFILSFLPIALTIYFIIKKYKPAKP